MSNSNNRVAAWLDFLEYDFKTSFGKPWPPAPALVV